ncbi:DUF416 family protein [Dyella nitratireducens]|uniref:DUF416 family protein n=1 Tax=Dyella nitratireducens TaxID=1849580 RepID=A0ABQ1GM10_9GAMM|nr:DUF416 family protein [Dyella nitratireducens]GGA46479.1 hypothetical protein GCM10010981_39530 [Dyella nitratireducens]GLQ41455.1 hypothetical protein GCM10007902_13050 [Dyella nitratireducens]
MTVLKYDEQALKQQLSAMPERSIVAFALCCSTRQLNAFEAYADKFLPEKREAARHIVESLWATIIFGENTPVMWSEQLAIVEETYPDEQDHWAPFHVYGGNALSSLIYTIRSLLASADVQEAAWAARIAYESADQAALRSLDKMRGSPEIEQLVVASDIVQRELHRQSDDLQSLAIDDPGVILHLKSLAMESRVLTLDEMLV